MTMTNQDGQRATENPVTNVAIQEGQFDFRKSIAEGKNVRLPDGRTLSPEAQIMFDKSIIAKNLGAPATSEIIVKNLSFHYYWGNFSYRNGARYGQLKSMGFTNATEDDVDAKSPEVNVNGKEIRCGDLILMKIPLDRWMGHVKALMNRSWNLQHRRGFLQTKDGGMPSTDVNANETVSAVNVEGTVSSEGGKYLTHYTPSQSELDGKMGPDTKKNK
jgi:hypothetical protein